MTTYFFILGVLALEFGGQLFGAALGGYRGFLFGTAFSLTIWALLGLIYPQGVGFPAIALAMLSIGLSRKLTYLVFAGGWIGFALFSWAGGRVALAAAFACAVGLPEVFLLAIVVIGRRVLKGCCFSDHKPARSAG